MVDINIYIYPSSPQIEHAKDLECSESYHAIRSKSHLKKFKQNGKTDKQLSNITYKRQRTEPRNDVS